MGKKSYSRQAMQKFIQADIQAVSAGSKARLLNLSIPEEVIIKRIVLQTVVASAASGEDGSFIASVCQNDSFNPGTDDDMDENRLVRSGCGSVGSPLNLDHTITMRKLAGSGISVIVDNVSGTSESYAVKLTLHYLEV